MNKTVRYSAMIFGLMLLIGACSGNRTAENSVGTMFGTEVSPTDSVNDRSEKLVFWGGRYHEAKPQIPQQGTILKALKVTTRISSNHYSDFALDEEGNAYIACFSKKQDNADYIYIAKISRSGEVIWAYQDQSRGRATAIATDGKGAVYAVGVFEGRLYLGGRSIATDRQATFIAKLDEDGNCRKLIRNDGDGLAFDISVNQEGEVLIAGAMGDSLLFGEAKLLKDSNKEQVGFIALFDEELDCKWIQELDGRINQTVSYPAGGFLIGGNFWERISIGGIERATSGKNDPDGFLLFVNSDGTTRWLRKIGVDKGNSIGIMGREAVQDITVDAEGNILATATMRPIPKLNRVQQVAMDLHFFLFSPEGAQLRNRTILHGNETNTVAKSAIDVQGNVWLATKVIRKFKLGNTHYTAEQDQQSILAKFDKHWDLDTLIQIHSGPNMMFRASETYWDGVVLTGHFKEWLEIGEDEVRSGTNNTLFYLNYHLSP